MCSQTRFKTFVLLFFFVYFSSLTPIFVFGHKNGDCLDKKALQVFRTMPSGYDHDVGIEGITCAKLCSTLCLPYAGIIKSKLCLCASSDDKEFVENVPVVDPALCSSEMDGYVEFYEAHTVELVNTLGIVSTSETVFLDHVASFETTFKKDPDSEFALDFGDGSPSHWGTPKSKYDHSYHIPGTFKVILYSRKIQNSNKWFSGPPATVKIVEKLEELDFEFQCPKIAEPEEIVNCTATLLAGQDFKATSLFGDGTKFKQVHIPGMIFIRLHTSSSLI